MSQTHFTRQTWRHGKRQIRQIKRPYGGQKTAPLAFLEAARQTYFRKGLEGSRRCKHCGRLAMKDQNVCRAHGGYGKLIAKAKFIAKPRTWQRPQEAPRAPLELTRLTIYQSADKTTRARLAMAWRTSAWLATVKTAQEAPRV